MVLGLSLEGSKKLETFLFTNGANHHNLFKWTQQTSDLVKSLGFLTERCKTLSEVMGGFRLALGLSYLHNRVNDFCEKVGPGPTLLKKLTTLNKENWQSLGKLSKVTCEVAQALLINYETLFSPIVLGRSANGAALAMTKPISFVGDLIDTAVESSVKLKSLKTLAPAMSAISGGASFFYKHSPVVQAIALGATSLKIYNAWGAFSADKSS